MKKCAIIFGILAIFIFMPMTFAWWDANYQYRKPITITETSGSDLSNYQVKLTIDTASLISAGKMNSDCSDIRFVDSDDSTSLSYWIEDGTCDSSSTIVWVKIPSITASSSKTIYMYYGYASATSESNGGDVFSSFASPDNCNSISWTTQGSITVTCEVDDIKFDGASQSVFAFPNTNSYAAPFTMDIYVISGNDNIGNVYFAESSTMTGIANWLDYSSSQYRLYKFNNGYSGDISPSPASGFDNSNNHLLETKVVSNSEMYMYVDGTEKIHSTSVAKPSNDVNNYAGIVVGDGVSKTAKIKYFFIRKYASSEPTYSIGSEETNAGISISSISLTPNPIYTNNDASCSAQFSDTADSATLKWYVGTTEITSAEQSCTNCDSISGTLSSSNFAKGDTIKCEVTATKGSNTDTADASEVVSNSPPTAPSLSYAPSTVYVGDTITATASGSTDADDDTITYYYQFLDGTNVLQDWSTDNTYTIQQSDAHSTITIKAKAYDGVDYSDEATQNVQVENSIPTSPSLSLSPSTIYVGDTLTATASGSTDTDGDTITYYYKFYNVNTSTILQDWSTDNTYTVQQSDAHDIIRVYARAYDGYGYSNEVSQDITISNSVPTISDLSYTPSSVYVGTEITASSTCSDADGDSTTTYYKFYNINDSSIVQDYSTDNTYVVQQSDAHDDIRIYAYCSDGTDSSSEASTDLSVLNSVPTAPTDISWSPLTPSINVQETVTASGSTDADNDTITYYYQFYDVNTSTILQDWSTTNTYTPNDTMENHTLRVNVKAGDGTGNSTEYSEEKTVLGNFIQITIHSPSNTTYYTDEIPFNVTVSSVYNFTASYYIDGNLTLENANETSYFTRELEGGSHTFVVNVSDTEGHSRSESVNFYLNLNVNVRCYDEETLLPIQCYATIHNDTYEDTEWVEESVSDSVTSGSDGTLQTKTINMTGTHSSFSLTSTFSRADSNDYTVITITLNENTIFSSTYHYDSAGTTENGGFYYNTQSFEFMLYNSVLYLYHNGELASATQVTSTSPDIEVVMTAKQDANTGGYTTSISLSGTKAGGYAQWTNIKGEKYVSAYSNIYVNSTGQTFYYPSRGYYEQSELANASIYLLNSNKGIYSTIIAKTIDGTTLRNYVIAFYRYYGTRLIKIYECRTDDAGKCTIFVNPNVLTIVNSPETGENRTIQFSTSDTYTVVFGASEFWVPKSRPSASCELSTSSAACQIDGDYIFNYRMKVDYTHNYTTETICDGTEMMKNGTLSCDFSDYNISEGSLRLMLYYNYDYESNQNWILLATKNEFIPGTYFGDVGKVFFIGLLMISGVASLLSPLAGMLMMIISVFAGVAMGAITGSPATWIGIMVIIGIIIYRVVKK